MPWSGGNFGRTNGTYSGAAVWQSDLGASVKIVASRHDTHDKDLADGIDACIHKGGQNSPTANISWGNFKITALGNGAAATDAATYGQTITAASWTAATDLLTLTRAVGDLTVDLTAAIGITALSATGTQDNTTFLRGDNTWATLSVGVSNINATGTPSASTYLRGDGTWAALAGGGTWGSITGTLSAQTDLQSALNGKAASTHTHTVSDITASGTPDSSTYLRGDGTWSTPPSGGGGGGTVTSVAVANATGISWSGSPITGAGTFVPTLSANLQAWHALATSSKADIASPTFTGNPTAPTPATGDNDTSIATTAFVKAQGYATLASPALTGNPTAPTPTAGDNDTSIATTAFVTTAVAAAVIDSIADTDTTHAPSRNAVFDALALKADLASPAFTGNPTAPTPATGDDDTSIATTAFVKAQSYLPSSSYTAADVLTKIKTVDGASSGLDADLLDGQHGSYYAPIASPTFTGSPLLTNADGTGTTRIPRVFVQSGDPGADAGDGDLWVW